MTRLGAQRYNDKMHKIFEQAKINNERYYSYDLYNTETEQVEATENHTPDEIRSRNDILRSNGEPQRWVATPRVNH